jgi:hypothetical protein
MIRLKYPKNFEESECQTFDEYTRLCQINLYRFKGILKQNINITRWKVLQKTFEENNILEGTFIRKINVLSIAYQFINELKCSFNKPDSCCYYYTPDTIRCTGTNMSLNKTIRLIEYGNDKVPPMNWIRHSYLKFSDYVLGNDTK